ncbi:MAG: hypothetical protein IPN74_13600 [Haliscomenobacter sp.]|nr:hypothetical protein [Haliscomenobacter sp.]
MKEQHPIDELFRRQLTDYQMETPLHLWSGIESRTRSIAPVSLRSLIWCASLSLALAVFLKGDDESPLPAVFPVQASPVLPQASTEPQVPATDEAFLRTEANRQPKAASPVAAPANRAGGETIGISSARRKPARALAASAGTRTNGAASPSSPALPDKDAHSLADPAEETHAAERSIRPAFAELAPLNPLWFQLETQPIQDFIPGIKFLGERWYASVELGLSQDWRQKILSAPSPEFQGYADARKATESVKSSHTASLRLSLISASGWTFRSGLQVSRTTEWFTQPDARTVNTFHEIDIPLLLGRQFSIGKLDLGINGGAMLNMAFYQKGAFLAPDAEKVVDFSSNLPDAYPAFKNRLGLGYYGSVSLSHPVTPSLHLMAEPYFRYMPKAYTSPDYPLEQRYRTAGIFFGFRKLLGPYWMNLRP